MCTIFCGPSSIEPMIVRSIDISLPARDDLAPRRLGLRQAAGRDGVGAELVERAVLPRHDRLREVERLVGGAVHAAEIRRDPVGIVGLHQPPALGDQLLDAVVLRQEREAVENAELAGEAAEHRAGARELRVGLGEDRQHRAEGVGEEREDGQVVEHFRSRNSGRKAFANAHTLGTPKECQVHPENLARP